MYFAFFIFFSFYQFIWNKLCTISNGKTKLQTGLKNDIVSGKKLIDIHIETYRYSINFCCDFYHIG